MMKREIQYKKADHGHHAGEHDIFHQGSGEGGIGNDGNEIKQPDQRDKPGYVPQLCFFEAGEDIRKALFVFIDLDGGHGKVKLLRQYEDRIDQFHLHRVRPVQYPLQVEPLFVWGKQESVFYGETDDGKQENKSGKEDRLKEVQFLPDHQPDIYIDQRREQTGGCLCKEKDIRRMFQVAGEYVYIADKIDGGIQQQQPQYFIR